MYPVLSQNRILPPAATKLLDPSTYKITNSLEVEFVPLSRQSMTAVRELTIEELQILNDTKKRKPHQHIPASNGDTKKSRRGGQKKQNQQLISNEKLQQEIDELKRKCVQLEKQHGKGRRSATSKSVGNGFGDDSRELL